MTLELKHISKSYNGLPVLTDVNLTFRQGARYCLMSPSGSGKTTLLRIIMGLEQADSGIIQTDIAPGPASSGRIDRTDRDASGTDMFPGPKKLTFSAVFQEDRLCESFSPIENVMLCAGRTMNASQIKQELSRLLPPECLTRPVSTLSGGMKRRAAVVRALLSPSQILLMDEPFTGMDENLKRSVIEYIVEKQNGRLLILSTHQEEDVEMIRGELIHL